VSAAKFVSLTLLAIVLSGSPSPANASTFDQADGWYKWRVESHVDMGSSCCGRLSGESSGELTIFVRSENGSPVRIRAYDSNCAKAPKEPVTDLGSVSSERSDTMLLEIVQASDVDMDVREEAMFWLVHTGSDATFEYVDRLLSSR
jgi:hypothetical protein